MVDNCYGEFVEEKRTIGSRSRYDRRFLIKNPGGGLAPIGGYICGRSDLIEQCAYRLTTPIGMSVPSTVATVFSPSIDLLPHPESIPIAITPLNATTVVFFTIFFILITNYPFTDVPLSHHAQPA